MGGQLVQTKRGPRPQMTPGGEGRRRRDRTGRAGTDGVVLIGFLTRQCQILAELVVTAAHVLSLGGEQPRR